MRSVLYRFPDVEQFERAVREATDGELAVPPGESVEDGEWVLAIFELGPARRATSAAGCAAALPEGPHLVFEPRDLERLAEFATRTALEKPGAASRASIPDLKPRVLIVDDDADIRDMVSTMLEAVDLAVVAVESAEDALDRLGRESFDLLVLDWSLPRMSGLELCRALRKDAKDAKEGARAAVPILFLTAHAASQDMIDAFACGADDYVVKPFRAPELGARIFSLLRRSRRGFS